MKRPDSSVNAIIQIYLHAEKHIVKLGYSIIYNYICFKP